MKKLKVLSKVLSSLGLKSHSDLVIKIAGESEVKYLEDLNQKVWTKNRVSESEIKSLKTPEEKKKFWSNIKEEFDSRESDGPIFNRDTLALIMGFESERLPKKNGKLFTKWLGRWIRDWNEIALSDQNTILDWWSVTGGTEEGKPFDERMIEILSPAYALQRAEEYHNDEGFYFDPTEKYLTPPDKNVIHDFGDGFKIVYVPAFREMEPYPFTEEELKEDPSNETSHDRIVEGNRMGVCLGKKMRLYQNNSSGKIYSLRNSTNEPCVTIRAETDYRENYDNEDVDYDDPDYEPFDSSKTLFRVLEFQGLGNSIPSKKYADYILRFFKRVPGHDEVDIDDWTTLTLTKMNSKDRGERLSAMRLAKDNSLVGNKVLSTDWKALKEDDLNLFNRIIINSLFNSKEDFLDFSKLGGDEEKKKLIRGSWRDFASSKEINLAKEISFSTGKEFLIELVPELLTYSSLTAILFPADHKTREKELRENPGLRSIVWNNRIKLEPVNNLKLYDAKRIIEFFKDEIISDSGISDTVKMIVKLLLEQKEYEYGGDTAKKLVEIQTVITSVVNSTLGINIQLINCGKLNDDVFQFLKEKKLELLYGISPFSIPMEVMKTGMSLEKNDYLNLFSHSNKESCGNTKELYDLTQFISGPVLRMKPLDIFNKEFWERCLIQNLNAAQEDETTFTIWIITAAASVPEAVKNAFSKILKENRRLLSIAMDTYSLGVFFSKEELIKILEHHGIDGKKADHQYY